MNDVQNEPPGFVDVKLLDGAAVVHLLPTTNVVTFNEYADQIFLPHMAKQLESCIRIDVVWDTYLPNSIKQSARAKRGKGIRRKVSGNNKLPGKWAEFLHDPTNKQELFEFLSCKVADWNCPANKHVVITSGSSVIIKGSIRSMESCNHEEADTRLMVHLLDAILNGYHKVLIRTVDTDVVVIVIGRFSYFKSICQDINIWIAFGVGKHFSYIHINAVYEDLGGERSLALPVFHSFTGCDTTSTFYGRGKKSMWEAWKCFNDVTQAFVYIALHPFATVSIDSQQFQLLERFTVIVYDKTSELQLVNELRQELFCRKEKTMERLPPTQHSLLQHTKRAAYQAGVWCTSEQREQHTPSPEGWGWSLEENIWVPVWSTMPIAAEVCSELIKCGCKSEQGCSSRCSCRKAGWNCTKLCNCNCNS